MHKQKGKVGEAAPVLIERHDGVAVVTLNRAAARNTLNMEVMELLRDAALRLGKMPDLYAVILCANGPFSAGADLSGLSGGSGNGQTPKLTKGAIREYMKLGPDMCRAWEEIEAFTIAAIEGYCVGGAAALVAAMDYRILGRSAFLRLPEVPLGINMSWQSIPRIVAQIGPARAKQYIMLGQRVEAATAMDWGLCEEIADDGKTVEAAQNLAAQLRRLPPLPLRMTKQAVNAYANALNHVASFMDRDQYLLTVQTEDFNEAIQAFKEKREPRFTGN